jgi:hypothetical protein
MAGAASAHQAATASREQTSQQRAGRTRRTSADPQRAQQGATAAPTAAPAALQTLSRLQRLADASPQVAQLRRLQALADGLYTPVAQLAGDPEEEELVQGKFASAELQPQLQQAPRANNTGLPDQLKSGIENLSGMSMDHVKVHYNSLQPAQLNALAYAQGNDIHLAPGQEQHLPHEAWHVVQQAQGRVRPTRQMKNGVPVNDELGLEQEANEMGAKASAQLHTDNGGPYKGPPSTNEGLVQRAVGFEFELDSVHTYSKNILRFEQNLKKKDVLVTTPGFKVEADEMPDHSNLEFVTDAFPETADGGDRLRSAVKDISTIVAALSNKAGQEITAAALGVGIATANRFMRPGSDMLIGKPQVTAGIKFDMMSRMLDDMAYAAGHGHANSNAKTFMGGQMAHNTGFRDVHATGEGMLDVAQAIAAADDAMVHVDGIVRGADPLPPVLVGSPELKALLTQLILYLAQGAVGLQGYGKLIAGGLMSRTDFATVFGLLPKDKHDYFVKFPGMFVILVLHGAKIAAESAGYAGAMAKGDPVFEGGLYHNVMMFGANPAVPNEMPKLTREAWLVEIVKGTDMLTAVSFPGNAKAKAEIESLGSYGNKMDNLSTKPDLHNIPAPLVELRGLKPLYAHLFPPMAMGIFRYIHIVNTGGHEDMPGHLMNLSAADQFDIASNNVNGIAARQRAVQDAMDEIEWW